MKSNVSQNGVRDLIDFFFPAFEETIKKTVKESLEEYELEKQKKEGEPLYTINQVRIKLKKSHHSVKKYVEAGLLRSTSNGLIPESAIEEFLRRE